MLTIPSLKFLLGGNHPVSSRGGGISSIVTRHTADTAMDMSGGQGGVVLMGSLVKMDESKFSSQ